jgi:hypothetical protein
MDVFFFEWPFSNMPEMIEEGVVDMPGNADSGFMFVWNWGFMFV